MQTSNQVCNTQIKENGMCEVIKELEKVFSRYIGVKQVTKLTLDTELSDLGISVNNFVFMVLDMGAQFDLGIPNDKVEGLRNVGDVLAFLGLVIEGF